MSSTQRKNQQKDFLEIFPQAIASLKKNIIEPFTDDPATKYSKEKPPLRSELFTKDQMEIHAQALARRHVLSPIPVAEQLLKRFGENESILLKVHSLLTQSLKQNQAIVPAGEWLLDNFYLIEEQIYAGKKHLPKGYSKELPHLVKGPSTGLPRVYDIAVEIISHSDGLVDIQSLTNFVMAYQSVTYLKLGELWAIPIMLRLALIENLRRISIKIARDIEFKTLANEWADKMLEAFEKDPKSLVLIIADMARSDPPMESAFVAELTRRLQEKGNALSLPLNWIEYRLSENGITGNEMIQMENQKLASDQVSISNSISSLRFLNATDWRDFVESTSIVEETLRQDINGIYSRMDFDTRDHYRHAVEKIAKQSGLTEHQVASEAITLSREHGAAIKDLRKSHVGYYLIGPGRRETEKITHSHLSRMDSCKRIFNLYPLLLYLGGTVILASIFSYSFLNEVLPELAYTARWTILFFLVLLASSGWRYILLIG